MVMLFNRALHFELFLYRGVTDADRAVWCVCSFREQSTMAGSTVQAERFAVHYLRVLKELLTFVLFSYTVLLGALVIAGWTTYLLVVK